MPEHLHFPRASYADQVHWPNEPATACRRLATAAGPRHQDPFPGTLLIYPKYACRHTDQYLHPPWPGQWRIRNCDRHRPLPFRTASIGLAARLLSAMNQHIVFDSERYDIPGMFLLSICFKSSLRKLQKNSTKVKLNFPRSFTLSWTIPFTRYCGFL